MLNKYKEAILRLCQLQDEYDKLEIQASTVNRNKRRANKALKRAELERDDLRDEVRDKLLKQKKEEYSYLKDEIDSIQKKMQKINSELNSKLENIDMSEFEDKMELDTEILITLSDTFAYVTEQMPDIVGRYEYEYEDCLETLDKLADKCGSDNLCRPVKSKVLILTDMEEEEDKSMFETVLDKLVGVPKDVNFSTKYRVIVFSCYLFIIILAFLNLSFLVLGAIGIGFKTFYNSRRENQYKTKCIQYLEDFKSMYQILYNHMNSAKEEYINDRKNKITDSYYDIVKATADELDEVSRKYESEIASVTVSEEEINSEVDKEFNSRLKELRDSIDDCIRQSKEIQEDQARCEKDLEEVQDEISKLRDAISGVYWELNEVGTEKVLMNEFFLGFKDYDLISVKHDGNAMCIVYDGESSERNSVLISMFIAQLFSNMLPNSLQLTIVDIDYTCRDYSIYNGKVFDLLFNYVTTEDAIGNTIEELHQDLIQRQKEISPLADNIDVFNKSMIAKNSFTKEYRFLIFQNAKEDYLKNQKLLQLCRTGQTFGIMPIVFISKELYNSILASSGGERECKPILESMMDYTWRFKQSTLDLEKIGG